MLTAPGRFAVWRRFRSTVFAFQQRVVLEQALDFLIEFERRQLQQSNRLLQLRRQRQVLRESEL
jgi:hypothetical protein